MKKFFLMLAAGLIAGSASAQKLVYEYDYSDKTSFPWYKMSTEADFITFEDGAMVSHNPLNAEGEPTWYQYFIADQIPTKAGESYTAVITCKASDNMTCNLNMGWGWGDGEQKGGDLKMTTDWSESSVVYKEIGGTSCNLVLQTTFAGTIEIKNVKVYQNPPAAQYETEDVETVNYASMDVYPYEEFDAVPVIADGALSFPADGEMFFAMDGVPFEQEKLYGIKTKIKGSKAGTVQVSIGDWGAVEVATLDVTEDWTEVALPVGVIPNDEDGNPVTSGFVIITTKDEESGIYYDGVLEMEYCTLATFVEIIPEPTTKWVSIIGNGNANDGESSNLKDREPGLAEDYDATITDNPAGDGKVFYCPIVANPDPGVNPQSDEEKAQNPDWSGVYDWSSQFFIFFDEALEEDDNLRVSFDFYCSDSRTINTQAHGKPGEYHHWQFIGDLAAKPEWQHKEWDGTISASQAGDGGCLSIAFNLSTALDAATFYINNVVVEVERPIEDAVKTVNAIIVPAQGVYNFQGVKVANTLEEVTAPGLYIANGKKVVKK